jgi:disulfide bond formation protein DsbB
MHSRRAYFFYGFLACAAMWGYALFSQYQLKVEPCPLCIFQRIGVAGMGLGFLLGAMHAPRGRLAWIYGALIALASAITIGIAARHVYIQHLTEAEAAAMNCGAGLPYMLKILPLTEVIRKVLTGSGECHVVNWQFLGLAMPTCVLIASAALGAFGVYNSARTPRESVSRAKL